MRRIAVIIAAQPERIAFERALFSAGFLSAGKWMYRREAVEVFVVSCGVGAKKRSYLTKNKTIFQQCDMVICAGLAGGVNKSYCIGDCILPETVCLKAALSESIRVDSALRQAILDCGTVPIKPCEVLAMSPSLVRHDEKAGLQGIDAVDMESYHVLNWMRDQRIAAVVLKVIGDARNAFIPADADLFSLMKAPVGYCVRQCFSNPLHGWRLLMFVLLTRRALAVLGQSLVRIIAALLSN